MMQAQNPRDSGRRCAAGTAAVRGGDLEQTARAIYAALDPIRQIGRDDSAADNETCSRPPTDLRGNPAVCASPLRQRYRGVMTALPRAACIMPTIRGAWQIGWIFSNGQAERLRRYSPLCYVAPILPAQPPLKGRYHALTAFPSAHSCDLEETHQTEKGDRHDAANAERIPNPHG